MTKHVNIKLFKIAYLILSVYYVNSNLFEGNITKHDFDIISLIKDDVNYEYKNLNINKNNSNQPILIQILKKFNLIDKDNKKSKITKQSVDNKSKHLKNRDKNNLKVKNKHLENNLLNKDSNNNSYVSGDNVYKITKDCFMNCNSNGYCFNSLCYCSEGHTGKYCELTLKQAMKRGYLLSKYIPYFIVISCISFIASLLLFVALKKLNKQKNI